MGDRDFSLNHFVFAILPDAILQTNENDSSFSEAIVAESCGLIAD